MKNARRMLILFMGILALSAACFRAAAAGTPRVILYTCYRQTGWGDRVQIGFVDEKGSLWYVEGPDSSLKWPGQTEKQLAWLQSRGRAEKLGELDFNDLFALKSLIASVENRGDEAIPGANDAGTECSYAVRYGSDGAPECVLLGESGDSVFENLDPNAQALYLRLRELFPGVTCYGGLIGPAGFSPVPLLRFCGKEGLDLSGAVISAAVIGCESGPIPATLTPEEEAGLRALVTGGTVTGKANAESVTGNLTAVSFYSPEGTFLCSFTFYRGLLVRPDGMYNIDK